MFELKTLGQFLPCNHVIREDEIKNVLEKGLSVCPDYLGLHMSTLRLVYNEALSKYNPFLEGYMAVEAANKQLQQLISLMSKDEGVLLVDLEKIWSVSGVFHVDKPEDCLKILADLNLQLFDSFAIKVEKARWTGRLASTMFCRSQTGSLALLNSLKRALDVDLIDGKRCPDVPAGTKILHHD